MRFNRQRPSKRGVSSMFLSLFLLPRIDLGFDNVYCVFVLKLVYIKPSKHHLHDYFLNMPLVQVSCSAPSPGVAALEVLAKLQDTDVKFETAASPSLKSVTQHPIAGSSTATAVSWVGCARSLSGLIPSLGLWEGPMVESWVDAGANTLVPILQAGKNPSSRL